MKRTILIACGGLSYFVISVILMIPLRTKPVANYLMILFPILLGIFIWLFYRSIRVQDEAKAYVYGFFAGIVLWQVAGELASIRVPIGLIRQWSAMNLKDPGSYIYLILAWVILALVWRRKAVSERFCFIGLTFLGIWTFELYMENYSAYLPLKLMPVMANLWLVVAIAGSLLILFLARRTNSILKQTILGGLLYLSISVVIMSAGQWRAPQSFYLKFEKSDLQEQARVLQQRIDHISDIQEQYQSANANSK